MIKKLDELMAADKNLRQLVYMVFIGSFTLILLALAKGFSILAIFMTALTLYVTINLAKYIKSKWTNEQIKDRRATN